MLYERTALSKRPDALIRQEKPELRTQGNVTPALVLKDLCVLDFLAVTEESSSAIWKGRPFVNWRPFPWHSEPAAFGRLSNSPGDCGSMLLFSFYYSVPWVKWLGVVASGCVAITYLLSARKARVSQNPHSDDTTKKLGDSNVDSTEQQLSRRIGCLNPGQSSSWEPYRSLD